MVRAGEGGGSISRVGPWIRLVALRAVTVRVATGAARRFATIPDQGSRAHESDFPTVPGCSRKTPTGFPPTAGA
nr:hypothetical protein DA06_11850 [Georgenia sp. SUBG003]